MENQHKDKQPFAGFKVTRFMANGTLDAIVAALHLALAIKFFNTHNGWVFGLISLALSIRAAVFSYLLSVAWRVLKKIEKEAEKNKPRTPADPNAKV